MDIQTISESQFKSITGVNQKQFEKIFNSFYLSVYEEKESNYLIRKDLYIEMGMRKAVFHEPDEHKVRQDLFMTFTYLKNYPSYEYLGFNHGMTGAGAKQIVDKGLIHLEKALDILDVLPKRNFTSEEELKEFSENVEELLIDVSERRIQRPTKNQKDAYSGKKKAHTIKNTVISNTQKMILFIGYTVLGRKHDYGLFKDEFLNFKNILKEIKIWVDLGYQGIKKDFDIIDLMIPHKKPYKTKNNPNPTLTQEQKEYNKDVSKTRILIEHAIGSMKIFRVLKDVFRNNFKLADTVVFCCAGLSNFKLKFK